MSYKLLQVASIQGIKVWGARLTDWTKLNVKSSINLFRPTEAEVETAIEVAERDLFENIICYELTDFEFKKLVPLYVTKQ